MDTRRGIGMALLAAVFVVLIGGNSSGETTYATLAVSAQHQLAEPTTSPSPAPTQAAAAPSTKSDVAATPEITPSASIASPTYQAVPAIEYPLTGFSWPAAGINVTVVPMDQGTWERQAAAKGIDPPADASGYDKVGHWLIGTGSPGGVMKNAVIAAHTCYGVDTALCNSVNFPFSNLTYGGWAPGQVATITDNANRAFSMELVRREIVQKTHVVFDADGDSCEVQVISCTQGNALATATLITFRRTQCGK